MKKLLSFTILSMFVLFAMTACDNSGDDGPEEVKYGELDIIDRALLPEILSSEWFLKGAGFTQPYIYEKSFSFEDVAEIPLVSFKGDGGHGLDFKFCKNMPATFATLQYGNGGGYDEAKYNKSSYVFDGDWHMLHGLCFKAKYPKVTEILYFTNNSEGLLNSWISYYGTDENHVTKIVIKSRCSHVPGYPIIDSRWLYMVFEK